MKKEIPTDVKNSWDSINSHSKSFSWATKLFNKKNGAQIAELYALCRGLDDIADQDGANNRQKLVNFQTMLKKDDMKFDAEMAEFYEKYKHLNLNAGILLQLVEGLIEDQSEVAFRTESELIKYCYKVAGTVGILMCPLLGNKKVAALKFAVDLGIGMQLTNIARDVKEDAIMNRRYLPGEWVNDISSEKIILAGRDPDGSDFKIVQTAIKRTLDLSGKFYISGLNGLHFLPLRSGLAVGVAASIYQGIGHKICKNGIKWSSNRVYTRKTEKLWLTLRSMAKMFFKKKHYPQHNDALHSHIREFENTWV